MSNSPARPASPPLPLFALTEFPLNIPASVATLITMYLLRQQGMGIEQSSAIYAFCGLSVSFYFLYAPMVDFIFRRRTWFLISLAVTALLLVPALFLVSMSHVHVLTALLFTATVASMLMSSATGALMSTLLSPTQKARVGAWVQAGSLGGNALGFGLLIWLSAHVGRPALAFATLLLLLPGLAMLWVSEPVLPVRETRPGQVLRASLADLRTTFFNLRTLPALLLLVVPVGTGALSTVLTGLTQTYGVTAGQLAFAGGLGGGLFTMAGALCILFFPAHRNRMVPYALSAILYGLISFAIAAGPIRPFTFIAGMLLSSFAQGVVYAAYTGMLLQTVNAAGRVQGTSYSLLNSIGNLPLLYMTWMEGRVAGHLGARSVGLFDGATNLLVAAVFFAWWFLAGRRSAAAHAAPTQPLDLSPGHP